MQAKASELVLRSGSERVRPLRQAKASEAISKNGDRPSVQRKSKGD